MQEYKDIQQYQEDQYLFPYHYSDLESDYERYFRKFEYLSLLKVVKKVISPFTKQSILDVGCGDGRLCYELKEENCTITGIDYSERAISFARAFSPEVRFLVQDVAELEVSKKFDVVILMEVLEHLVPSKIPLILTNIEKILKDDGKLIITVPSTNIKLHKKHYQHFTPDSLSQTIASNFKITQISGFGRKGFERFKYNIIRKIAILVFTFAKRFKLSKKFLEYQNKYFLKHLAIGSPKECIGLVATCVKK